MAGERLILTGFMGMGKSTVGPKVADRLGIANYDVDAYLETESGIDIPELVKADMAEFRRLEAEALHEILDLEPAVISTGGGIVSTEIGRAVLISSQVPVVWLKAPFKVAKQRVRNDSGRDRPLFDDVDTAHALFRDRQPWYRETASHVVDAANPVAHVVDDIVEMIQS